MWLLCDSNNHDVTLNSNSRFRKEKEIRKNSGPNFATLIVYASRWNQILTSRMPNRLVFCSISIPLWNILSSYSLFRLQTWTWHSLIDVSSFPIFLSLPILLYHKSCSFSLSYLKILRKKLLTSISYLYTPLIIPLLLHSLTC